MNSRVGNPVSIEIKFVHIEVPADGMVDEVFLSEMRFLMLDIFLLDKGFDTVPALATSVRVCGTGREIKGIAQKFKHAMRNPVDECQQDAKERGGKSPVFNNNMVNACRDVIDYFSARIRNALRKGGGEIHIRTFYGRWRQVKREELHELLEITERANVAHINLK